MKIIRNGLIALWLVLAVLASIIIFEPHDAVTQIYSVVANGSSLPANTPRAGSLFLKHAAGSDSTLYVSTGRSWVAVGSTTVGVGGWQDVSTEVELTTTTDDVVIGGTSALSSAKVTIDGDADQIQFIIQGHSTQTSNIFTIENSSGQDLMWLLTDAATFTAMSLQAATTNDQTSINLLPSSGSSAGWALISDILSNGTNNFVLYNRSNADYAIHVSQSNDFVGIGNGQTSTAPWANLSVSEEGTTTFSITNSTLGYDATSGMLISMPTTGLGTFKVFDENFEFNSSSVNHEYVFDVGDDNDNDMVIDDAGVVTLGNAAITFTPAGTSTFTNDVTIQGAFSIGDTTGTVLAAAGTGTITGASNVILDTFGGAALDTVTTLTGVVGQIIHISTRVDGRDIAFLDAGNFSLGAERLLDDADDVLILKATSATTWKEEGFFNNN